jgi:membrane-bound inhibitor of C-type lysozyme
LAARGDCAIVTHKQINAVPIMKTVLALTLMATLATSPALADTGVNLGLTLAGDATIKTVQYACESGDPVSVQYINAAPNFLALLPVDGKPMVFVSVVPDTASKPADGTKYVAGPYELWTKDSGINLQDVTEGLDAAPVLHCTADNQAP